MFIKKKFIFWLAFAILFLHANSASHLHLLEAYVRHCISDMFYGPGDQFLAILLFRWLFLCHCHVKELVSVWPSENVVIEVNFLIHGLKLRF